MAKKPRLTKADKHSLAAHISWAEWGNRFGFRLYGTNDEHLGHFTLQDGSDFVVPKAARDAIDAVLADK
jgi:hypothetical protein